MVDVIVVPFARAFGGRNVRNRRAGFAQAENGLNLAETSVINFVIILAASKGEAREILKSNWRWQGSRTWSLTHSRAIGG